jgi:hypothetical protein
MRALRKFEEKSNSPNMIRVILADDEMIGGRKGRHETSL